MQQKQIKMNQIVNSWARISKLIGEKVDLADLENNAKTNLLEKVTTKIANLNEHGKQVLGIIRKENLKQNAINVLVNHKASSYWLGRRSIGKKQFN